MVNRFMRLFRHMTARPRLRHAPLFASVAVMMVILMAGCEDSTGTGDLGLIPDASPTPAATAAPAIATMTPAPGSFDVIDGVNVYAEIPPMRMNISQWRETDFRRFTVDPDGIFATGADRNGIPPIYEPQHIATFQAATLDWMTGDHPVIVVSLNGEARAYPLGIMTFHQVVNDTIGGQPIVVTYSPLSFTAMAYSREVDGVERNFGTTGNVHLSNLVMWDDGTESWWQQANGEAIVGAAAGTRLTYIQTFVTSLFDFARSFPEGTVLAPDAGSPEFWQLYGATQHTGYDAPNNPPRYLEGRPDDRLSPTERVLGIAASDQTIAYPFAQLRQERVINTQIDGEPVVIVWKTGTRSALDQETIGLSHDTGSAAAFSRRVGDRVLEFEAAGDFFRDTATGTQWTLLGIAPDGEAYDGELAGQRLTPFRADNALWFTWAAFNPNTEIFTPGE